MTDQQTARFLALLERQAEAQEKLCALVARQLNVLNAINEKKEDENAWRR